MLASDESPTKTQLQNYETSESKLKREFEQFGPIKKVYMVYNDKSGKHRPRGYAFIEYERERDMHCEWLLLVVVVRARTLLLWH